MNKKRIIIYAAIFGVALAFILLGLLFDKKEDETSSPEITDGVVRPDSKDNPLDGDDQGNMPDRGLVYTDIEDIYEVQKQEDNDQATLNHKGLAYGLRIPQKDLEKLKVEETNRVGIISTAFYYEKEDIRAYVFSINNFNRPTWEDMSMGLSDIIIGETPIRVITYSQSHENPFEEGTEASDEYLELLSRVPQYVEGFVWEEEADIEAE